MLGRRWWGTYSHSPLGRVTHLIPSRRLLPVCQSFLPLLPIVMWQCHPHDRVGSQSSSSRQRLSRMSQTVPWLPPKPPLPMQSPRECRSLQRHYTRCVGRGSIGIALAHPVSRVLVQTPHPSGSFKSLSSLPGSTTTSLTCRSLSARMVRRISWASRIMFNHRVHHTDLIAAILKSPEFAQVSKSTIEEIAEKVGLMILPFLILTHLCQRKQKKAPTK